jgi:hypothetical protein
MSDMLLLGDTQDLLKYWQKITVKEWISFTEALRSRYPAINWGRFAIPETWLAARYLNTIGISIDDPETANNAFWHSFGGIINATAIDQEWFKTHSWFRTNYHTIKWFENLYSISYSELTFEKWFLLHYCSHRGKGQSANLTIRM